MMKRSSLVDSAYCGRRRALITPAAALLTDCVQRGRVSEELRWYFEEGGLCLDGDAHNNTSARPRRGFTSGLVGKFGILCIYLLLPATSDPPTTQPQGVLYSYKGVLCS